MVNLGVPLVEAQMLIKMLIHCTENWGKGRSVHQGLDAHFSGCAVSMSHAICQIPVYATINFPDIVMVPCILPFASQIFSTLCDYTLLAFASIIMQTL